MTDEIVKSEVKSEVKRNRGGRPPVPSPPQNADECRALIAAEVIRSKPKEHTLRGLLKLLNEFKQHEKSPLELKRLELLEQTARQKQDEIDIKKQAVAAKKADYRLRFSQSPVGARNLLASNDNLLKENAELRRQIAELIAELEGRAA